MSSAAPAPAAPAAASGKPEEIVDVLEEDDDFEEFEQQDWSKISEEVEDPTMWQDGWEDDEEDENFTRQLRMELATSESSGPPPTTLAGLLPTAAGARPMQQ
eukprot:jgi/Chrpa1/9082/Chrysochromulina_OHIO_Genome00007522-RA